MREIAAATDEWAGIPMPVDGEELVIHPSYPWAHFFNGAPGPADPPPGARIRNSWWSRRHRVRVVILETADGKIELAFDLSKRIDAEIHTMGASVAWGIEQEANALQTLAGHLRHHQLKYYLLTGMFPETSRRSGITYLFRKLRPTVALKTKGGTVRMLCSLCMHPIGYYEGSWAGAMCPTDDVIAHLMMMRADEHLYWKRCNQIPAHLPESGL